MIRSVLCSAAIAIAGTATADTTPSDVIGTWQTPLAEQPSPDGSESGWLQATVIFTQNRESLQLRAFADQDQTIPLFTYFSEGPYSPATGPTTVPGAVALDLQNDLSEVTLHQEVPGIVAALNLQDCPLVVGQAVEISDCVGGPPFNVGDCVDMDVVMIDEGGNRLRFGREDFDRCVTRPTALSERGFFKVAE